MLLSLVYFVVRSLLSALAPPRRGDLEREAELLVLRPTGKGALEARAPATVPTTGPDPVRRGETSPPEEPVERVRGEPSHTRSVAPGAGPAQADVSPPGARPTCTGSGDGGAHHSLGRGRTRGGASNHNDVSIYQWREAVAQDLQRRGESLHVAGLFAGIGGIECGLEGAGHRTELLCELDSSAASVLRARFPGVPLVPDVRELRALPRVDLVTAGFPCQDLSQAGRTAGIRGGQSGLVSHVFRLVERRRSAPRWLLLENVPFMLQLDQGRAMHFLTDSLAALGFAWAYRVVDTRAFGLPHRRQRVLLLASRAEDPRSVLFEQDAGELPDPDYRGRANGFYWTEGTRGLGWAVDAVPTLKGGSTVGIPSPPAIWMPDDAVVKPDVMDAERLQGFPAPNSSSP